MWSGKVRSDRVGTFLDMEIIAPDVQKDQRKIESDPMRQSSAFPWGAGLGLGKICEGSVTVQALGLVAVPSGRSIGAKFRLSIFAVRSEVSGTKHGFF